jgi:tetratricopeptide (TPR) repeat protein
MLFVLAAVAMVTVSAARGESPALLLEKGVFAEETKGDIDAAITIYKQIVDDANAKGKYVAQALSRLGGCYVRRKKTDEAIVAFRALVKHFPDQKILVEQAAAKLEILAPPELAGKNVSVKLASQAWTLWSQQKLEESEKLFRQALEKDPNNANAWNGLGWVMHNQGKTEAADAFKQCLTIDPKNSGALNGLGWVAKQAGKEEQAIAWWQKAVTANPQTTAALRGLVDTLTARGKYTQAAVFYDAWLRVDPSNKKIKAESQALQAKAAQAVVETQKALAAAEKWLAMLDEGQYEESWDESATLFRTTITKQRWVATISNLSSTMGKVESREKIKADYRAVLPGGAKGQYVVFTFKTACANKPEAVETVTPMKDKDGTWRVSGYYIK